MTCRSKHYETRKKYRLSEKGKEVHKLASSRHYEKKRAVINEIKNVPCQDCGGVFPPCVMDFDHRDPSTKEIRISSQTRNYCLERLLKEIEKCDIVCANCHRIRTYVES